jgi:hypothetical protein
MRWGRLAGGLIVVWASLPGIARAADPVAESLYQEGRRAAQAHDWALACRKFQESHDREPAPGTLLNLADCEEKRGQLVEAFAHFEAATHQFKDERSAFALRRATAVGLRTPRLTLSLRSPSPSGTVVERDGMPVNAESLGNPVAMDPGEHTIVVRARGRSEVRTTIRLSEGETREIELTAGVPIVSAAVAPPVLLQATEPSVHAPEDKPEATPNKDASTTSPLKSAAIVSFVAGGVGVGLGIAGGIITLNAKSTVDTNCPASGCNPTGLSAESRGSTWSTVSTVSFIAGGVGLASGIAFWLAQPKSTSASALTASPTRGGAQLRFLTTF